MSRFFIWVKDSLYSVLVGGKLTHTYLPVTQVTSFFKIFYLFIYLLTYLFREKRREGEGEGEKHRCKTETLTGWLPLLCAPDRDGTYNPGKCPDW